MNSKEKIVNSISNKLYNFFELKYGDQFIKLNLTIGSIISIVNTKLKDVILTRSIIPTIIANFQETIDKIVIKQIYSMNNSNIILNNNKTDNTNNTLEQDTTPQQNIVLDETTKQDIDPVILLSQEMKERGLNTDIFSNLINENKMKEEINKISDTKANTTVNTKNDTEYLESFPFRERNNDTLEIKDQLSKINKELSFNIVVNSNDRDKEIYKSPYNYKINTNELSKFKNSLIKKITLTNCIIKTNDLIKSNPFITLNIKELNNNYYNLKEDNTNIFCYLDLYKEQNGFLYYKCNDGLKNKEFITSIILESLSISLHLPNNEILCEILCENETENELETNTKLDPEFNNQFIFNIEYEYKN
jgi:hypothetical protein